jgi:hypothetical protein
MDIKRKAVRRVMTVAQATELCGAKVPHMTPTFHESSLFYDEATKEPILATFDCPDLAAFERHITGINWRDKSEQHITFGFRGRRPMMKSEGCEMAAFSRDNPETSAYLSAYSIALADILAEHLPEIVVMGQDVIQQVLPDWRLSSSSLWTSGVINYISELPYHRDGNNFDAWSVMPVVRYGVTGGHLHIPEYGVVCPCRNGQVVAFYGKKLVHGVTPMRKVRPDGYRISCVYYALKGLRNCAEYAVEVGRARERRTARERSMAERVEEGVIIPRRINKDTRSPGDMGRISPQFHPGAGDGPETS